MSRWLKSIRYFKRIILRSFIYRTIVIEFNHGWIRNPFKSRIKCIVKQQDLHCFTDTFNKDIGLRMSSRTHIKLGIQFPRGWLLKFTNKSGIHVRYNYFRNTIKFVAIVNKEVGSFFRCDFLWQGTKWTIFVKWQTRIRMAVKLNLDFLGKSVTKSMPTTSEG